jgi:hypothetical protein
MKTSFWFAARAGVSDFEPLRDASPSSPPSFPFSSPGGLGEAAVLKFSSGRILLRMRPRAGAEIVIDRRFKPKVGRHRRVRRSPVRRRKLAGFDFPIDVLARPGDAFVLKVALKQNS